MTTHTTIERKQEQNQHKHKDDNEINNETNVRKAADAAGIGSGYNGTCGNITISSGVTSVEATMGYCAGAPIGYGNKGTCGSISIDGTTSWSAGTATEHFKWTVSTIKNAWGNHVTRWTLTHK